ncbi:MAG TPA: TSUP family transporter [Kineosporiaceae bacterium]|nr:TSUP family transporter [Kineosporiaceae bacterium]
MLIAVLAFGVGISLGLLGGGGSVLSVPLLVYVAGWSPHTAATGSLLIVGVTSMLGLVPHARAGRVQWRSGAVFGLAGMAGAFVGGRLSALVPGTVLLLAFAAMMLVAGVGMVGGRQVRSDGEPRLRLAAALALGLPVGAATGFVGAGGGFVIVPTLVLVAGLSMPVAVGTSLLVIAMQSAAGAVGHLPGSSLPWAQTLALTTVAALGSVVGGRLTRRVPPERLRRAFGVLVLGVAALVIGEQLPPAARASAGLWVFASAVLVLVVVLALATARALRRHPTAVRPRSPGARTTQTPLTTLGAPALIPRSVPPPHGDLQETTMSTTSPPTTMVFTQYYIDCLSQASYLVGDSSTGRAVVVDPRRDVQEYLDDAAAQGLRIIGVVNTHFHADFLSGHLELAAATGAWIGYGRVAQAEFEIRPLADGERIDLGDVVLEIIETPGHTPESISLLVFEHAHDEIPYGVLTGDALFIGDVGRPDLLASIGHSAHELGAQLYDSIQRRLMALPDSVRVFPAHGAGSACGKNLSTARQSTIGEQRLVNYACRPMSQADFVALVTAGQPSAPEYFGYDAVLNRKHRRVFDADTPITALDDAALKAALAGGAVVLDARDAVDFAAAHLRGALNVPADGRFAETAGMVLTADQDVVVVAPQGRATEVAVRLARIGFDEVLGYVPDPESTLLARQDQVQHASRLTPPQLTQSLEDPDVSPVVIDVRNAGEREAGFIRGSLHIPLAELRRRLAEVPSDRPLVTYCAGGWRSSVAASLLRRHGFADVSDLLGGFAAWTVTGDPVSA